MKSLKAKLYYCFLYKRNNKKQPRFADKIKETIKQTCSSFSTCIQTRRKQYFGNTSNNHKTWLASKIHKSTKAQRHYYFRWLNLIVTVKTVHNEGFIEGNLPFFAVNIIFTTLNNFMTSCNNEETIYDTIYHQNCFTFNKTLLLQQQFCYIIDNGFW